MHEPGVAQRPADAFARLLQRRIREPDDREARKTGRNVDLDPDHPAVEADEGGGRDGRKHRATVAMAACLALNWRSSASGSAADGVRPSDPAD